MQYLVQIIASFPKLLDGVYKDAIATVQIDISGVMKIKAYLKAERDDYYSIIWPKKRTFYGPVDIIHVPDHKLAERITDAALDSLYNNNAVIEFSTNSSANDITESILFSVESREPICFSASIRPFNNSELFIDNYNIIYRSGEFYTAGTYYNFDSFQKGAPVSFYGTYVNDITDAIADYVMDQLVLNKLSNTTNMNSF